MLYSDSPINNFSVFLDSAMCLFDEIHDQRNYFSRQLIVKCAVYFELWNLAPGLTMLAQVLENNITMSWQDPRKLVKKVSECGKAIWLCHVVQSYQKS